MAPTTSGFAHDITFATPWSNGTGDSVTSSVLDYGYSYGGMANVGPEYEFRIPGRLARMYERELAALRLRRPGVPEKRLRERVGHLYLWYVGRMAAAEEAERAREFPPARPPKTRTEWGMVHRERCVHRMGNC